MFYLGVFMMTFGIFSLVYNRNHFLSLLLSLEMVMLAVFFMAISCTLVLQMGFIVFFLIVVVCEAGLGLSVLVSGVYFLGSDYLQSDLFVKC